MSVAAEKNKDEILKIVYEIPDQWESYKDPVTGWTGNRCIAGGSTTVTVKWKDSQKEDQVHTMGSDDTVLHGEGVVRFSK